MHLEYTHDRNTLTHLPRMYSENIARDDANVQLWLYNEKQVHLPEHEHEHDHEQPPTDNLDKDATDALVEKHECFVSVLFRMLLMFNFT